MYFKPIKPEQIQLAVNQLVKQSSSQSGGFSSADAQLHLLTQYSVWSETCGNVHLVSYLILDLTKIWWNLVLPHS